jgi:hypothetical protein
MDRREFLVGSAVAAPAIVRAGLIMPVKSALVPSYELGFIGTCILVGSLTVSRSLPTAANFFSRIERVNRPSRDWSLVLLMPTTTFGDLPGAIA